jgi:glutamyl-Q tRNA(Asp) synthetase
VPVTTRFAPSPTGPLHLGHAFSALTAFGRARASGGRFLLRMEDIDTTRCRPEWEALIAEDLHWLGLDWPEPVLRQSRRLGIYRAALERLWAAGLLYPCTCRRADIAAAAAASAPQEGAPLAGPDGIVYPGTCRPPGPAGAARGPLPDGAVLRLDMARAMGRTGPLDWTETGIAPDPDLGGNTHDPAVSGPRRHRADARHMTAAVGDVVLARRGLGTSYHLAVVVDDAAQAITEVVRGSDLAEATPIHVALQRLLGLPTPRYHHHRLIRDDAGRRLAKRDDARALRLYREAGTSPAELCAMIGLAPPPGAGGGQLG